MKTFERRKFLRSMITASALTGMGNFSLADAKLIKQATGSENNRFKISLNAYSFNELLRTGKTTLDDILEFCAKQNFDAIDMTGYYFPGYPEIPADGYIYHVKRKAHQLGLEISGTGIRNEFAEPDKIKRAAEVVFVKRWIEVAAKLGAPVIRIFTGKLLPQNYTWEQVAEWIAEDIKSCVDYGKQHGVIVAVQNHNDFVLNTMEYPIDEGNHEFIQRYQPVYMDGPYNSFVRAQFFVSRKNSSALPFWPISLGKVSPLTPT